MLSCQDIVDALELAPADPNRLAIVPAPETAPILERGATSLDLRLGRWFRSFKQSQTSHVSLVGDANDTNASEVSRTKQHFVPFGESFVLHPGRFVLGVTLEWIRLPQTLSGYVTGKSSLGRHGLVIETAAGLHPNFSGCLTLELANVGEVPLEIFPGMQVCQIFLHKVSACEGTKTGRVSGQRKPTLPPPSADAIFHKICDYPFDKPAKARS